jgi:hypothetical protein
MLCSKHECENTVLCNIKVCCRYKWAKDELMISGVYGNEDVVCFYSPTQ